MTIDKKLKLKGCLFAFLAGIAWGVASPLAQFLFEQKGVVSEWLVPYRLLSSGLLLLVYAIVRKQDVVSVWKERQSGIQLVLFGILGMMGMQSPLDGRILMFRSFRRPRMYFAFSCSVVTSSGCASSSRRAARAAAVFAGGMEAEKMNGREL